jgi:hypothetical protein
MKKQHIQTRHIHKLIAIADSMGLMFKAESENFTTDCVEILDNAVDHDLLFEVVWSAFEYKTEHPKASMLQSLQVGAREWDV